MPLQDLTENYGSVNAHGTSVRRIMIVTPGRVTEFFYQKPQGVWIMFKRIVHTVH